MKKTSTSLCDYRRIFSVLTIILLSPFCGFATNPVISNFLTNLSSSIDTKSLEDLMPEMVVEGNTIHLVWIAHNKNPSDSFSNEDALYYCRSTDLGKTWETPTYLTRLKGTGWALDPRTRKLAVDGSNVYIGLCDYDLRGNYTGHIYFTRSTNGGTSFDPIKEIVGGSMKVYGSHIKAVNGNVAIAYFSDGIKPGLRMLSSVDGGATFSEKPIATEPNEFVDFYYSGSQMIVVSEYTYWYSGLDVGKIFVSVSNDNGATFITNKVSSPYNESATVVHERSMCYYNLHYAPKIAKSGNNIHVIFEGYNDKAEYTTLYARSTDNGKTFEKARDINNAVMPGNQLQTAQQTIVAKNGHVYMAYLSKAAKVFFVQSEDNGNTLSAAKSILPDIQYVGTAWWPSLVLDPNDTKGTTVFLCSHTMFSTKSTDGGKSFTESINAMPLLSGSIQDSRSDMVLDSKGNKHWISESRLKGGTDQDIFYRNLSAQPTPGNTNKALSIETTQFTKDELTIIPSTSSIEFDSAMTAEAWVKFDPSTLHAINILAKVNSTDIEDLYPNGYQLGFRKDNGKMCINSGIETDKGDFVNWGDCSIGDTLWHHVAFSYDAKAGLNNFKTYIDGLLKVQQTVTGKIIPGNGLLMIGSRATFYGTTKYQIDNIRLWNKALSQDELINNQVKIFTGKEPGLKLFLNFDDTFKDISGNGNDAIPLYLGILKSSDFNPPIPGFDLYQSMNQVSLTNKTKNGTAFSWNYGDGNLSNKGNPVYVYLKPGEYSITLETTNANSKTAIIKKTTIVGLDRIEPLQAGNGGYSSISVFGGGLIADGTSFSLRKNGSSDIAGENLFSPDPGVLSAQFLLDKASLGKWDVVVKKGTSEQIIKEAFQVVQVEKPAPWATLSGRGRTLINMWQSYTITYGNNGNVDAYGVPVWFAITDDPDIEIEFIDFEMKVSDYAIQKGIAKEIMAMGQYLNTDMVQGESFKAKVYPFMVPVIPAKSTSSIHIRIKSPIRYQMKLWTNLPWYELTAGTSTKSAQTASIAQSGKNWTTGGCILGAIAQEVIDVSISALGDIPGCIWNAGYWVYDTGSQIKTRKATLGNTMWNAAVVGTNCGIALSPWSFATKLGLTTLVSGVKNAVAIKDCIDSGQLCTSVGMWVDAVTSFDPNEMIGPAGFGDKHWMQKSNTIPYTILFENKSTATAPAHIVTVTDTLDLKKFDLKEFGFGAFGFGDTTMVPIGEKLKQFSIDVDLKPKMNLITRVSGKLDTISGLINWEFISLNPTDMNLEEDPMVGFLPPNNTKHAGEGFVSFSVGLKKELETNAELKNKASIVFDANKPILTNEFTNTLDLDKPQSQVYSLNPTIGSHFPLAWTGSDLGSGIASYSVYVMENDTALRPWKLNTTLKTAEFIGNIGSKYKFYSVATDNVSLLEAATGQYDASTQIVVHVDEFEIKKDELQVFPNPVKDKLNISLQNAPCGMYVVELVGVTGQVYYSEMYDDFSISKGIQIGVEGYRFGQYLVRIVYGNKSVTRKVMIE